jgi:hypothetical protein
MISANSVIWSASTGLGRNGDRTPGEAHFPRTFTGTKGSDIVKNNEFLGREFVNAA